MSTDEELYSMLILIQMGKFPQSTQGRDKSGPYAFGIASLASDQHFAG